MEITNFLTWFLFIAGVIGIGLGVMVRAYIGSGSISILFPDPVLAPPAVLAADTEAAAQFQQGVAAFQAGKYRKAVNRFSQAIQRVSTFAEAYHNRGLAFANLRQDDDAARNLVKAGEGYLEQGNQDAFATVKQNLEALKARKQARENRQPAT
jgi:tetratricopeptide (TPR) repeat protein